MLSDSTIIDPDSDFNVTVLNQSHGFRGFFSSKTARRVQRLKEKVGITPKLEDKEYENLLKSLKKNCELMKKPVSYLLRYVDGVREVAFTFGSLCRVLKSLLPERARKEQAKRLTVIQHDLHVTCVSFLDVLGELETWIRRKQIQQAEKNFNIVQDAVHYCSERRLDSVVVSKVAKKHSSKMHGSTFVNPVFDNNGYLDSTFANKTFPSFNTPSRVQSVQNQAARLYNDAKQSAIDAISEAMATNAASQFDGLSALQPAETEYEVKSARARKRFIRVLREYAQDCSLFTNEQNISLKEIRKSWIKLTKTLSRYSESLIHLCQAKADFHHAAISAMQTDADAALGWFPDATRETPMLPVNQLRDVVAMLQRTQGRLDCAQVIYDLSRSYTEQDAGADDLKYDLQSVLADSFKLIMEAEEEIKVQAKEIGKRWKSQLKAFDQTMSHSHNSDPLSISF